MKKFISLLLIILILFNASSCTKKYSVQDVIDLINNIGQVSFDSGEAINKAQLAYDSLDKDAKLQVTNHVTLLNAQSEYGGFEFYKELVALEESGNKEELIKRVSDAYKNKDQEYYEYLKISEKKNVPGSPITELVPKPNIDYSKFAEIEKGYMIDDIPWHEYPSSHEEHWENFAHCLVWGTWDWLYGYPADMSDAGLYTTIKPDVLGIFMNQNVLLVCINGHYYLASDAQCPDSPADIQDQLLQTYLVGKQIRDELHASKKITDGMTELQRAQVYVDYLSSYGITIPEEIDDYDIDENTTVEDIDMSRRHYDDAYGALVNKSCTCGGRASAFSLLLNIEGIRAFGVHLEGHIISQMMLDKEEYFCDWGNGFGIFTMDDYNNNKVDNAVFPFIYTVLRATRDYICRFIDYEVVFVQANHYDK